MDRDFAQTVLNYYNDQGQTLYEVESFEDFINRVNDLYAKNIYTQYDVIFALHQRFLLELQLYYTPCFQSCYEHLALPDYSSDSVLTSPCDDSNSTEICVLSPSEEKTLSMVLSFFFPEEESTVSKKEVVYSNSTALAKPNNSYLDLFLNLKIIQKAGSTGMRAAKVLSIGKKISKAYTPGIGLLEKALLKFHIFPTDNDKFAARKKDLLEIIENAFDEKNASTWTEDQRLHKDCAKEVLLEELRKKESDSAKYKTIEGFVNLKLAGDALQLTGLFGNPLLTAGSALTGTAFKDIVPPLQIFLQFGKLYPQCAPALNELLIKLSSMYKGETFDSLNDLDALLLNAIQENKSSFLHKSAACGRVLAKIFTASLSLIYPGSGSFLSIALLETANAFTGFSLKTASSMSKKEEIFSLVNALQETYQDKPLTEASENLKFYLNQFQIDPSLFDSSFLPHLQFYLAKKLVGLDKDLMSYIILLRLRDENSDEEDSIRGFLKQLGISQEDMQKWTCLTKFFGPNFKYAKTLVQEALLRN